MSRVLIGTYLRDRAKLQQVTGSRRESVLREAFKDLLKANARTRELDFAPEHEFITPLGTRVYPDGAVLHALRVPLGWWEAKDEDDDLDREIEKKRRKGYPQDNILFEDGAQAILIQNKGEVLRAKLDGESTGDFERLLKLFFEYERPEIAEFRKAVEQFKADLPNVLKALRESIDRASADNPKFRAAEAKFLAHAKDTINPAVTLDDVREMLIQHILTEEIFSHVFDDGQFHRENNVAKELYALERALLSKEQKQALIRQLSSYYAAIRANAARITSHSEKQKFLKVIYENFYKVYNPKAADRLGVIYTPNEIVRFMIESADWLCEQHFGKRLIDRGVNILDPATGTGTFVCELLNHFRGEPKKLRYKYKEEIFANEVAILPYYVANLNIEATYAEILREYAEFPNLCFVDTLDNVAGLGKFSGYQEDMFGAVSEENVARVKRQNEKTISVIIGNPPYNANQQNENDNNKNRTYPRIDARIRATYIKESTAQKTKLYDMYARFFRWASDRLKDDGIVSFVTNRSFIDSRTFDGFRKIVARDFAELWIVDLGGDVRANPKLSGTKNNVFGIQTGVAVSFLVKRKDQAGRCSIRYVRRPEMETADDKLAFTDGARLPSLAFERIKPDAKANWLNLTENDFESFIPLASKETKASRTPVQEKAIFKVFSLGLKTNRDEWMCDFSERAVADRTRYLLATYTEKRSVVRRALQKAEREGKEFSDDAFNKLLTTEIKWTRKLKRLVRNNEELTFDKHRISDSVYRPFVSQFSYFSEHLNEDHYQLRQVFRSDQINTSILLSGHPASKPLHALASEKLFHHDTLEKTAALSRWRFEKRGTRLDNITDWALAQFRTHYEGVGDTSQSDVAVAKHRQRRERGEVARSAGEGEISAPHPDPLPAGGERGRSGDFRAINMDDVFDYVYAVLHDPVYREKYALNLKREFPRIPFYPDFFKWAAWGERLMALHIGYESVEPWPLTRTDTPDAKAAKAGLPPRTILKADRDNGIIVLDSETQLSGVPAEAWRYVLGNRSALDWVLDQHKEKTPKDPTIREKFNTYRFADYKEKVVDLLGRVTRVSVETVAITDVMRELPRSDAAH